MLIFLAIILFLLLIIVHEYGHFLVAKRNGVEVEEFGIGFPPKIGGKTFGRGIFRSYYTLNWLPLGGFVRLKGEYTQAKGKGTFGATSFWTKTKIITAGVFMNFIIAVILFTVLAAIGMPTLVQDQYSPNLGKTVVRDDVAVVIVDEDSPAARAGLQTADTLVSVGGQTVTDSDQLFDLTESLAGQTVEVEYFRNGEFFAAETTLNPDNEEQGYFGVGPTDLDVNKYNVLAAPVVGVGTTLQLSKLTLLGLANMVTNLVTGDFGEATEGVAGPVGLVVIVSNISAFGFSYMLFFIAVISLTLAIFNALPIPALDGGRLFVTGMFKATNRPLTPSLENKIHGTGFAILMLLVLMITFVDVNRFF